VLDPGIGFFRDAGVPWHVWTRRARGNSGARRARPALCVGVSRKSSWRHHGREDPARGLPAPWRDGGSGARRRALIRTHDVAETVDAVRVAERVRRAMP